MQVRQVSPTCHTITSLPRLGSESFAGAALCKPRGRQSAAPWTGQPGSSRSGPHSEAQEDTPLLKAWEREPVSVMSCKVSQLRRGCLPVPQIGPLNFQEISLLPSGTAWAQQGCRVCPRRLVPRSCHRGVIHAVGQHGVRGTLGDEGPAGATGVPRARQGRQSCWHHGGPAWPPSSGLHEAELNVAEVRRARQTQPGIRAPARGPGWGTASNGVAACHSPRPACALRGPAGELNGDVGGLSQVPDGDTGPESPPGRLLSLAALVERVVPEAPPRPLP